MLSSVASSIIVAMGCYIVGADLGYRKLVYQLLNEEGTPVMSGIFFCDRRFRSPEEKLHRADILREILQFSQMFFTKVEELTATLSGDTAVILVYETPMPPGGRGGYVAFSRLHNVLGVILAVTPQEWGIWEVHPVTARSALYGVKDKKRAQQIARQEYLQKLSLDTGEKEELYANSEDRTVMDLNTLAALAESNGTHFPVISSLVRYIGEEEEAWRAVSFLEAERFCRTNKIDGDFYDAYIVAQYARTAIPGLS